MDVPGPASIIAWVYLDVLTYLEECISSKTTAGNILGACSSGSAALLQLLQVPLDQLAVVPFLSTQQQIWWNSDNIEINTYNDC